MFTQTRDKRIVTLSYRDLHIFATFGTSPRTLTTIAEEGFGLEFALLRKETERDFLAGYHMNPYLDVTMSQPPQGDLSLVACTLEAEEGKKVFDTFLEEIQWKRSIVPEEFIDVLVRVDVLPWALAYEELTKSAKGAGINPRKLFYMSLHTNFLQEYIGQSYEEALAL